MTHSELKMLSYDDNKLCCGYDANLSQYLAVEPQRTAIYPIALNDGRHQKGAYELLILNKGINAR